MEITDMFYLLVTLPPNAKIEIFWRATGGTCRSLPGTGPLPSGVQIKTVRLKTDARSIL